MIRPIILAGPIDRKFTMSAQPSGTFCSLTFELERDLWASTGCANNAQKLTATNKRNVWFMKNTWPIMKNGLITVGVNKQGGQREYRLRQGGRSLRNQRPNWALTGRRHTSMHRSSRISRLQSSQLNSPIIPKKRSSRRNPRVQSSG